jgi:hypothetical protein
MGLAIAYAPHRAANPAYEPYGKVLRRPDLAAALGDLGRQTNLRFSVVTDDRPFSLDLFQTSRYFQGSFWETALGDPESSGPYERYRVKQLAFVAAIIVAAVVLILGPLAFARGPAANITTLNHLVYFSALGAGFMLIEIGMMHRMGLLLGNPGLSIAIVLAALILFSGIGSFSSDRAFARGLTFRWTVIILVLFTAGYLFASDGLIAHAMRWPLWAKSVLVVAITIPFGVTMGQLMPQGLVQARQDDSALVPWAWAINGALGTIAAGVAPLLAQAAGFRLVVALGAVCYCVILALPRYAAKATMDQVVSYAEEGVRAGALQSSPTTHEH